MRFVRTELHVSEEVLERCFLFVVPGARPRWVIQLPNFRSWQPPQLAFASRLSQDYLKFVWGEGVADELCVHVS